MFKGSKRILQNAASSRLGDGYETPLTVVVGYCPFPSLIVNGAEGETGSLAACFLPHFGPSLPRSFFSRITAPFVVSLACWSLSIVSPLFPARLPHPGAKALAPATAL